MASTLSNPKIVTTAPPAEATHHPRRPPAKRSVSLLHSSKPRPTAPIRKSASPSDSGALKGPSSNDANTESPSSLQALGGRGSSGESSNAEKWFEKSNNEVRENSASFADNDPPFFMRNSSSSETPPEAQQPTMNVTSDHANSLPLRTGLLHLGTDGSSTEDYRSVIDDLTVENKNLKRRLKKYEKLHDSHLKDEKLFEVRMHGLPAEKKRELEETLRKFAATLGPTSANVFAPNGYADLMPMLNTGKTASSQTSFQHADSAYASMSASGQGSSAQSGNDGNRKMTPSQYPAARRENIHNYLHHIPEGLLPQQTPATMTDKAKKKLVVRRMEQIFAGKGAQTGGHQHSIQQEEVSQSAARTDRSAGEAAGHPARKEGTREADIMAEETERETAVRPTEHQPSDESKTQWQVKGLGQPNLAEQRPTRPLDLDPHRAQVPEDNIRYMRHLGFSPYDSGLNRSHEDGHGWIYLNFLINMAQLHTINVTTDFVRKSLSDHSHKFEVSSDGRRVRWRGGNSVTRTSSSGGGSSNEHTSENTPDGESPRKRMKLAHSKGLHPSGQQVGFASRKPRSEHGKYTYTPLFFHREASDEADDSSSEEEEESMSSPYPLPNAGDSSNMTSSGKQTTTAFPLAPAKKKQKHDDGPIIFYNNARFCTDLSGDHRGDVNHSAPRYTKASTVPIGKTRTNAEEAVETRGPLAQASELPEPMDIGDNPIPESMELAFPESSPARSHSSKDQNPVEFEVTGIGGVWPADNFSISVESRHGRIDQNSSTAAVSASTASKAMPPRFAAIFRGTESVSSKPGGVRKEVVASKFQEMPPSRLPPALGYMGFDEDSGDDSDGDDDESEAPESPGAPIPSAAPQPLDILYASSDEEDEEDDDEEEEESDGEVDFLASARQADPEAVRQREREYDANMAERLAEEIPAGSSAATAGGGSGFVSPASGVNRSEYRQALQDARKNSARAQNKRVSDSQVVQMNDTSSEGESDDEMSDAKS